tara:strand:- start:131 stop:370 length:240 start_codon:yes stop_codon:yes gene_type:complete
MTDLKEISKIDESEADATLRFAIGKFESLIVVGYSNEHGLLMSTGTQDLETGDVLVMMEMLKGSMINNFSEMLGELDNE